MPPTLHHIIFTSQVHSPCHPVMTSHQAGRQNRECYSRNPTGRPHHSFTATPLPTGRPGTMPAHRVENVRFTLGILQVTHNGTHLTPYHLNIASTFSMSSCHDKPSSRPTTIVSFTRGILQVAHIILSRMR